MFRRHRDRHGELQRVVDGNLRRLLNGVVIAPLVDIVIADDVRYEDAIENPPFRTRRPCIARNGRADGSISPATDGRRSSCRTR